MRSVYDCGAISASTVLYKTPPKVVETLLNDFSASSVHVRLFVVDNSPVPLPNELCARIQAYVHRPDNPGFGAGHNLAIRAAAVAGTRYHGVINPDISFGPNVISQLIRVLVSNQRRVAVMPAVRYPDGRFQAVCRRLPHPVSLLQRWLVRVSGIVNGSVGNLDALQLQDVHEAIDVPLLSGCFFFARLDSLIKTGGFDERFFLYFEDFDLSRRMGEHGSLVYDPTVHVFHSYGAGSYHSLRLLRHHTCSAVRYFNKWGWLFDGHRKRLNAEIDRRLEALVRKQRAG
jgi:GT2 family glycosyltransferase